ncbi:insulin-like [Discoglossus pictus]
MAQKDWAKVLLALVFMAYVSDTEEAGIHRLCGSHLVDALLMVCEDRGFFYKSWKASVQRKNPHLTAQHGRRANKKRQGIVEKCCFSSCTYYDLESYCNN